MTIGDGSSFLAGAPRWVDGLGRLRDVVRQRLVAAQLSQVMTTRVSPARVLDVGCGQGTQALGLARAGDDDVTLFLGPDPGCQPDRGRGAGPIRARRFRASKE